MRSYVVKGLALGSGRTKTVVSLMERERPALLSAARRAACSGADLLEWRADFFPRLDDPHEVASTCRALTEAVGLPILFTVRTRGQGGEADVDPLAYARLVRVVSEQGSPDLVDIECGVGEGEARDLVAHAHANGALTVVSHHDFAQTPDTPWMLNQLLRSSDLGADLPKLAVMAHDSADCARLLEATALAVAALQAPVVGMAMGACGSVSRLVGEGFGSALTFCALGTPSAPGQVSLGQALPVLERLHEAVGATRGLGRNDAKLRKVSPSFRPVPLAKPSRTIFPTTE